MKSNPSIVIVCSLWLAAVSAEAQAPKPAITIKLATLAPKESSFEKTLRSMGDSWAQVPGGASLRIHPGGVMGGEADMVSKMRIGQIDAALLTANGLADIDPAVQSLQCMPMMFRSLDEVDFVAGRMHQRLEQRMRARGFIVLFWTDAGWVRFFSSSSIHTPEQLKAAKLFTWAGDTQTFDIYKSSGFHPVALETNDILPMLRTGMIDAVPSPPYVALATQSWTAAKNMLVIDWAPLVGALVVTERAWNRLPPDAQAQMAKIAAESGTRMTLQNRMASDAAVSEMKKRGLTTYTPAAGELAAWHRVAEASYPQIRGKLVPAEYFDEVQRLVSEYRGEQAARPR